MLHPVSEFSYVQRGVFPFILTCSARFTIEVLSGVRVAVCKHISSRAVLKTKLPFTFVSVSVFPLMNTESICLALCPLADIRVSEDAFPNSLTFFEAILPLALIYFSIYPDVNTLAVRFVLLELAFIAISVTVPLHTSAVSIVNEPLAFVETCSSVLHNS
jgi:hypothetical protein